MRPLVVVPARMASTRFPGKPLAQLAGKPMVQWVVEACLAADVGSVVVAAPDPEIIDACENFGCTGVLTSHDHATGTDRIAEVARIHDAEVYVNVQGDEPLVRPSTIRACVQAALSDPTADMASVYGDCPEDEADDPNVVKVVMDSTENALYFSRSRIPFPRNPGIKLNKHIGLYAYRRSPLLSFASWPQTPLELSESLEQLRFLENGCKIKMAAGDATPVSVDTPEQGALAATFLADSNR